MRDRLFFALAAASLGVSACVPNASFEADSPLAETHAVQVLAGDRMVIDGQSLTLADAQAPRPAPQAACRAEAAAAGQAGTWKGTFAPFMIPLTYSSGTGTTSRR